MIFNFFGNLSKSTEILRPWKMGGGEISARKKLQGEEGEFFIPNLNFSCFQLSFPLLLRPHDERDYLR